MDAFYTIPTLDISKDTSRQTIVDFEKGLYLGHPTTVLLEDGKTIIIVYPKNHGNGQIVLKKSTDGGLTWSERFPVPDSWSTSLEVPTIYRTVDKDGKKRLIMFSGLYPIRMSVSEDNGETWSELEKIGDYGGIVAMGDIEPVGNGRYIALFHDDGRFIHGGTDTLMEIWRASSGADARTKAIYRKMFFGGKRLGPPMPNWIKTLEKPGDVWEKIHTSPRGKSWKDGHLEVYLVESQDGGLTWSEPRMICSHTGGAKLCEPTIIRSPDGKQLCVIMREESRKFNSFMITSNDEGKTWSGPVELPAALSGDRHTSKYLNDGRLFISFRDMTRETPTKGDWVGWIGTYDDIINGREGQYRIRLMKNYKSPNGGKWDCAYPGVEVLPDGTVVTATYGHFTEGEEAYIACVRFHPNELEGMEKL